MKTERYFAGDAMVGNKCKKAYMSFNDGNQILIQCLNNFPEEKKAFLESFKVLAKIHNLLFNEYPTREETEECAKQCEYFLENYPLWFPTENITRKCFVLGKIFSIFIRREKSKIFKSRRKRGITA